ncbi:dual specificity protein phosphatase 23-like [Sitophilus oryzae]|uniref:Dual specificity protein phosphatase 23 n=1 Tax=Sitophilus oryzae TaxID=7048 RepID=A0A6J2X9C3_SITOR|nr:dual specificity protein phosphatase 23-like [Sitophilus oryzae]
MSNGYSAPWNFSWVLPNELAATSCPQTLDDLEFLKSEGIRHLVTLSPEYIPPIRHFNGIKWSYIPIEEFEPPTLEDMTNFIKICQEAKENNEAVAVHCRAGRGRTGVMVACYFVRFMDMAPDRAITNIRMMRPGSVETHKQERAVRDYRDLLRSK